MNLNTITTDLNLVRWIQIKMWKYDGSSRPPFADEPNSQQESVWDYPRPPRVEISARQIRVESSTGVVAETSHSLRVIETASPPVYYLSHQSVDWTFLRKVEHSSWCEWKGLASYLIYSDDNIEVIAGWSYEDPSDGFDLLKGYISFYPGVLNCFLDMEEVLAQPGKFYGGWVTEEISGPLKGGPGTSHW